MPLLILGAHSLSLYDWKIEVVKKGGICVFKLEAMLEYNYRGLKRYLFKVVSHTMEKTPGKCLQILRYFIPSRKSWKNVE